MTIETVVRIVFLTAGIVYMGFYAQRAIQGNLFNSSRSLGLQFDPRDSFEEIQRLSTSSEMKELTMFSMVSANIRPFKPAPLQGQAGPVNRAPMWLESLPTGQVPREPAWVANPEVDTDWKIDRKATYTDRKSTVQ